MIVALCVLALIASVDGHIHSQKLRHIERERVTVSTWVYAVTSSLAVGACGVFPLIVNRWVRLDRGSQSLKAVLSFAVGGLLGDTFLHLLPEAWNVQQRSESWEGMIGVWVLAGLLTFMVVEKLVNFSEQSSASATEHHHDEVVPNGVPVANGTAVTVASKLPRTQNGLTKVNGVTHCNGTVPMRSRQDQMQNGSPPKPVKSDVDVQPVLPAGGKLWLSWWESWLNKDISGYLNLLANCTDNFTHGLAIAASYVASPMVGLLTTLAILCHEIPHEIGDFAILLNSGFDLHGAAVLQMVTSFGGVIGVVAGLTAEHMGNAAGWLLPFTAGGFLYIALVSIVPGLLQESNLKACITQLLGLVTGVVVMAMVTMVEKKSCSHMPMDLIPP